MSYNTRQRELILDYIKKNAKKHLTADDIADALKGSDVTVLIKNPMNPDIELWGGAVARSRSAKPPYTAILKSSANRISSGNSFSAREKAPAINITMNSNVTIIFI